MWRDPSIYVNRAMISMESKDSLTCDWQTVPISNTILIPIRRIEAKFSSSFHHQMHSRKEIFSFVWWKVDFKQQKVVIMWIIFDVTHWIFLPPRTICRRRKERSEARDVFPLKIEKVFFPFFLLLMLGKTKIDLPLKVMNLPSLQWKSLHLRNICFPLLWKWFP